MKKKLFGLLSMLFVLTFSLTPSAVYAGITPPQIELPITSVSYEYNTDGSYVQIVTTAEITSISATGIYTRNASKTYNGCNSSGDLLWSFSVYGSFSVNPGVSATCTSTSYSTNIPSSSWQLDSASTYASGNQAIGDATFIRKLLFITVETRTAHVVLTCDSNGNCY